MDKYLLSAIVAPLYNLDHVVEGTHLENLKQPMEPIQKTKKGSFTTRYNNLIHNEIQRYHFLEFPDDFSIHNSVIDFKHYFTVNLEYLMFQKKDNFVCSISELYREQITVRFSNYLSRIGLSEKNI